MCVVLGAASMASVLLDRPFTECWTGFFCSHFWLGSVWHLLVLAILRVCFPSLLSAKVNSGSWCCRGSLTPRSSSPMMSFQLPARGPVWGLAFLAHCSDLYATLLGLNLSIHYLVGWSEENWQPKEFESHLAAESWVSWILATLKYSPSITDH